MPRGGVKGSGCGAPKGHPPYNNGAGGRPPDWTDERIEKAAESLEKYIDDVQRDKKNFWWQDWCYEYGICPSKASEFAKANEKFRQAYKKANAWQEHIIVKGMLAKKLDSKGSIFFLTNKYRQNWSEKPADNSVSKEDLEKFQQVMNLLQQTQAMQAQSARKIEETNIKAEEKS